MKWITLNFLIVFEKWTLTKQLTNTNKVNKHLQRDHDISSLFFLWKGEVKRSSADVNNSLTRQSSVYRKSVATFIQNQDLKTNLGQLNYIFCCHFQISVSLFTKIWVFRNIWVLHSGPVNHCKRCLQRREDIYILTAINTTLKLNMHHALKQ